MNGLNLSNIQDAKLGSTQVSALYYGSQKIWPTTIDYSKEYLTIESLENNNDVYFDTISSDKTALGKSIEYSTDLTNWISVTDEWEDDASPFIKLSQGQKVYLRGTNSKYANLNTVYDEFFCMRNFSLSGNIMSLIYGSNFIGQTTLNDTYTFSCMFKNNASRLRSITNLILPATTLTDCCYYYMFHSCTGLTSIPSDLLPATTLAQGCYYYMFYGCTGLTSIPSDLLPATTLADYCYSYMFEGCSSLTTAPELPATTLADSCYMSMFAGTQITSAPELPATTLTSQCYRNMFYGCTSLTYEPPELPATTLQTRCYQHMFYGCTSLENAPELPATTLVTLCYNNMFSGCTSLRYIKCLATDISASGSHSNWVNNVAAKGFFVKPSSMTSWESGASGIPSGWTVFDA